MLLLHAACCLHTLHSAAYTYTYMVCVQTRVERCFRGLSLVPSERLALCRFTSPFSARRPASGDASQPLFSCDLVIALHLAALSTHSKPPPLFAAARCFFVAMLIFCFVVGVSGRSGRLLTVVSFEGGVDAP